MSPREREIRSRLNQLIAREAMARGNLSERGKVCGKPNCRCASGEKHPALYLVASDEGRLRQLFIPRKMEAQARDCVEVYHKIRELLEELSQIYWDKLKKRDL
jgi:hypothetical protein